MTRPKATSMTKPMKSPNISASRGSSPNAWTDCTMPVRVSAVAKRVSAKAMMMREMFQTRSMLRRSCTITEWRNAVAGNQGNAPAFSTGSQPHQPPQPSSS